MSMKNMLLIVFTSIELLQYVGDKTYKNHFDLLIFVINDIQLGGGSPSPPTEFLRGTFINLIQTRKQQK